MKAGDEKLCQGGMYLIKFEAPDNCFVHPKDSAMHNGKPGMFLCNITDDSYPKGHKLVSRVLMDGELKDFGSYFIFELL